MLFLAGMVGFWFFTTQYLQGVLGLGPLQAGLAFLPTTIPNFMAAMMVPRLTRRLGNARLLALGLAISVVGMFWLAQAAASGAHVPGLVLPMILVGLGQGAVLAPLTVSAVTGVRAEDAGAASGVVNVAHQLGGSIGLAVLVVVFAAGAPVVPPAGAELARHLAATFQASSVMLLLALALVPALVVRRRPAPSAA
jgi:predicted MFS family arabinose efflux permease